jgi:hypothetical protein
MTRRDAIDMLADLRTGPYRARGGRQALADDLGIPHRRLVSWLSGQCRPTFEGEGQIRRLWEAHGLDQEANTNPRPDQPSAPAPAPEE